MNIRRIRDAIKSIGDGDGDGDGDALRSDDEVESVRVAVRFRPEIEIDDPTVSKSARAAGALSILFR